MFINLFPFKMPYCLNKINLSISIFSRNNFIEIILEVGNKIKKKKTKVSKLARYLKLYRGQHWAFFLKMQSKQFFLAGRSDKRLFFPTIQVLLQTMETVAKQFLLFKVLR